MVKISVAMSSLNGAESLEQSILSVLNQDTTADVQFVVMDGGSTDGTVDILKKYGSRITWRSEKDKCPSDALNKAFALCDGDIMAWINADDFYEPGAFEVAVKTFENNPDAQWMAGYYRMINSAGHEIRRLQAKYKHLLMRNYSYPLLVAENTFAQPSVFMRREALARVMPLDYESVNCCAFDYELWLNLGKLGRPVIVPNVLSNFRYLPDSITGSRTAELFRAELNYARKEFRSHPIAVMIHHLNWLKIRIFYSWWRW